MISRGKAEGARDLIYRAHAESAFQPLVLSAGARGMWHLCSGVETEYGPKRDLVGRRAGRPGESHRRRQYICAICMGCTALVFSHAAHNCGPGNVQKGTERTGYADFLNCIGRKVLPRETQNYVPIIPALTLIAKDAAHYGRAETRYAGGNRYARLGQAIDRAGGGNH
jgi:membrane-bound lytic murein transglycosylase D